MHHAKGNAAKWLSRLIDAFGEEATEQALVEAHGDNPDPSKLLGNTEGLLTQRRYRESIAADARRAKENAEHQREIQEGRDSMTSEEQAHADAEMTKVGEMLKSKGMG